MLVGWLFCCNVTNSINEEQLNLCNRVKATILQSVFIVFTEQNSDWIYKTFKRKECVRHVDDEKNPGL